MLNWVTFLPLLTTRISGSRVSRPVNRTRFMALLLRPARRKAPDDGGRRDKTGGSFGGSGGTGGRAPQRLTCDGLASSGGGSKRRVSCARSIQTTCRTLAMTPYGAIAEHSSR